MFGIGWAELSLVALVLLVFVGPKHLPGMLQKFGQIVNELRSASRELRNQIDVEVGDIESPSKIARDIGRDMMKDIPSPYNEVQQAEEKIKQAVRETVDDVTNTSPQEDKEQLNKETESEESNSKVVESEGSSTKEDAS